MRATRRRVIVTLTKPQAELVVRALDHYAQWCNHAPTLAMCKRATGAVENGLNVVDPYPPDPDAALIAAEAERLRRAESAMERERMMYPAGPAVQKAHYYPKRRRPKDQRRGPDEFIADVDDAATALRAGRDATIAYLLEEFVEGIYESPEP